MSKTSCHSCATTPSAQRYIGAVEEDLNRDIAAAIAGLHVHSMQERRCAGAVCAHLPILW